MWTWTAIDADTKLVPSWLVGERTTQDCYVFLNDLRSRLLPGQRIQITTDGFAPTPQSSTPSVEETSTTRNRSRTTPIPRKKISGATRQPAARWSRRT